MEVIYLLTPQHTGTWFAIAFLLNHPQIDGFVQVHKLEAALNGEKLPHHPYIEGIPSGIEIYERLGNNYTLLHEHPHEGLFNKQLSLTFSNKTIITLRDPEKAISSRHKRHTELWPHTDFVKGWVNCQRIVELTQGLDNVYIFQVDKFETENERKAQLDELLEFLGLPNDLVSSSWAALWPTRINSSGGPRKLDKDFTYFTREIGTFMKMGGYDAD